MEAKCRSISRLKKKMTFEQRLDVMHTDIRHWLEYDSVALAALFIGLGVVELLVLGM
jgi:hypothetical protein